jgi:hypothetical protein
MIATLLTPRWNKSLSWMFRWYMGTSLPSLRFVNCREPLASRTNLACLID